MAAILFSRSARFSPRPLHLAQERQADHAVLRDAHGDVQLGHLEDRYLQQVLGADLVFIGLGRAGLGLSSRGRVSVLVLVLVLAGERSHISFVFSYFPHKEK